ncbi:MAG: FtsX-like permease family protein [Sideroxydans sp.]|nr:FtsX-like permease family protein [Sideroxydans sp.]
MSNWLIQHWLVFLFTLRRLLATPVASLLNIAIMGIALSLPVGVYVLLQNVQGLAAQAAGAPQISVFLAKDASKDDVAQTGKRLAQLDDIERIEFVPREQALDQLKHSTGLADVIGGLSQNPLPDAYILYPKTADLKVLEGLRDRLQTWPKLEHVQLDSAWARKLEALLGFVRLAVLILASLLSIALVAITFNTIRLQILTKRDEIEVSKLIGATHAFIRRPFLYFGLLQGLLAGAAAWLIISLSLYLLNRSLAGLAELYASNFTLHHLSAGDSLSLLLFSAYLGWLGAWLSVSQHLWQIEPK